MTALPPLSETRQRVVLVLAALTVIVALTSRNWVFVAGSVTVAAIGVWRVVRSRRAAPHAPSAEDDPAGPSDSPGP